MTAAAVPASAPGPSTIDPVFGFAWRRVRLHSGDLAYIDEGVGRPVVFLHGAPVTALGFARVIRGVRGNCRALAPDLPGFGASRAADGFDGSLGAYAAAVREFCLALDLRDLVLYLNDASACFGLAAAADMRDRVAGVVVADTVPIPMTGAARAVRLALRHVVTSRPVRLASRRWNLLPWLVATVAPWRRPFARAERLALRAAFDTPAKRERPIDLFAAMATDDAFLRATAAAAAERLAATPALIVYGQFDPVRIVGGVRRYAAMLPRHRVYIVPWEEHFPILAAGDEVAAVVRAWVASL
jgi:pimeloyl-ACP methyl ester carboxylesterase